MLRLLGSPRNFPPLPLAWDGVPIVWEQWSKRIVSSLDFALGPPSCTGCDLHSSLWSATGWWARSAMGSQWQRRGMRNFHAERCGWCGHTSVFTRHDEQSWDLDETDYGPAGSLDPGTADTLF